MTGLLRRCSIEDKEFVEKVLNDPGVRPYATDDLYVGYIEANFLLYDKNTVVLRFGDYGIIVYRRFNFATYDQHFYLLGEFHHNFPHHYVWVQEAIDWMFTNTNCLKIIGLTTHDFKHGEDIGFIKEGVITKSHMMKRQLLDLHVYGCCKDIWEKGNKNG